MWLLWENTHAAQMLNSIKEDQTVYRLVLYKWKCGTILSRVTELPWAETVSCLGHKAKPISNVWHLLKRRFFWDGNDIIWGQEKQLSMSVITESLLRIISIPNSQELSEEPWTDHPALVQLIHGGQTQMCACGKVNSPLWSWGPSADHHTPINQGQTSATPLITLHLEELLHIYHRFKGALRDLICIPHVFHHRVFVEGAAISCCSFTNTTALYYKRVSALERNVSCYSIEAFHRKWESLFFLHAGAGQVLCAKNGSLNTECLHEKCT